MIYDAILHEDFELIASSNIKFNEFQGKVFLVTGATGLIGSLMIKTLLYCNEKYKLNLKVIALIRNIDKAKKIFGDTTPDCLEYYIADLEYDDLNNFNYKIDYVIHAASITASKEMITNPVGTINTSISGTNKILSLAVDKNVESVVYISSMEVYGIINKKEKTFEHELGYVDLTSVRSCYPEGKRICECLCTAYAVQYGLNVKSARLAQTFGAGILYSENRVFAQFAKSVINHEDILLHTDGTSEGNYVYTRDAIKAILILLLKGEKGQAYNISNENCHVTIADMAHLVADKVANKQIRVVFDIPEDNMKYGYAPKVKMHLDSTKMQELGWKPEVGLLEAYERMIKYITAEKLDN